MHPPEIGTSAWKEWRRTIIGASDAPIIMDACPFGNTPYTLWLEKMGIGEEKKNSRAMEEGIRQESHVRELANRTLNANLVPQLVQCKNVELPFLWASLDGIDGRLAVEIKVSTHTAASVRYGKVPQNYFWQMQHQLLVTDLDEMVLVAYDPQIQEEFYTYVHRDEKAIEKMVTKECEFYEYMRRGEAPPLGERDYEDKSSDKSFNLLESDYISLLAEKKRIEERLENKRNEILKQCPRATKGNQLLIYSSTPKGRVEYSSIPELQNVNLDLYRKKGKLQWTIRSLE